MEPSTGCRICSGPVELVWLGLLAHVPGGFVPTCHRPGGTATSTAAATAAPCSSRLFHAATCCTRSTAAWTTWSTSPRRRAVGARRVGSSTSSQGIGPPDGCSTSAADTVCFSTRRVARPTKVEGVELSTSAAEHARNILGLTVHGVPLEDVALDTGRYDVVVLADVLEHLEDPLGAVSTILIWWRRGRWSSSRQTRRP